MATIPAEKPFVSFVVPVHNAGKFIGETLESILAQDSVSFEIILVDDCSTDDSAEAIRPYLSDRVKYFREPVNRGGPAIPRNTGIREAAGEYIALFDADDVMLPGALQRAWHYLQRNRNIGMVFTSFQSIDESGTVIEADYLESYTNFRKKLHRVDENAGLLKRRVAYVELLRANFVGTPGVVARKAIFTSVGGFDESLTNGDDYDMWLRIAKHYDILFIDVPSFRYRKHVDSISFRPGTTTSLNRIRVLERQLTSELDSEESRLVNFWLSANYFQLGYTQFQDGEYSAARGSLVKSLRTRPSLLAAKVYMLAWLGSFGLLRAKK